MALKLKLEGFDDLLKKIEKAGGDIDRVTKYALRKSADVMQKELEEQMTLTDDSRFGTTVTLIKRLPPPQLEIDYGKYTAHVGYKETAYNPDNPSDYHKAIFLNYGTPYRTKHGVIKARGFVNKAKRRAKPKIKKLQKEALEKILARLKK